jgi:hypothetical protein
MEWFGDCYCPDKSKRRDPQVSPLYGDLAGGVIEHDNSIDT